MATVTLTSLWLHTASDLSDYLLLGQNAETEVYAQPTEVRRYAGGRLRAVTRTGAGRTLQITLPGVEPATYESLKERVGVEQMLRDQRGRKLWGVIGEVTADEELGHARLESISFTFLEVTDSEEV